MLGLIWPCNSLAISVHPSLFSALVDLNGRFFAGREVRASFFDFDKYRRPELYQRHVAQRGVKWDGNPKVRP